MSFERVAAGRDERGVQAADGAEVISAVGSSRRSASAKFIVSSMCPAEWPPATTTRGAITPAPIASRGLTTPAGRAPTGSGPGRRPNPSTPGSTLPRTTAGPPRRRGPRRRPGAPLRARVSLRHRHPGSTVRGGYAGRTGTPGGPPALRLARAGRRRSACPGDDCVHTGDGSQNGFLTWHSLPCNRSCCQNISRYQHFQRFANFFGLGPAM